MTIRRRRATWRETLAAIGVAVLPLALDLWWPRAAGAAQLAFIGFLLAIASAVGHFFNAFGSATLAAILQAWQFLRVGFIELGRAVKSGLWGAGRAVAKLLRSTKAVWDRVLKPALSWANDKLLRLERWLHDTFAPVLRWLRVIKEHIDLFYRHFIRPILDTIEFIRYLTRTLEAFHIHWLDALDKKLQEVQTWVEEPFLWLRGWVTWAENTIDRIITADGFFQRLTLVRTLAKHAPDWIHILYARTTQTIDVEANAALGAEKYPRLKPLDYTAMLTAAYQGRDGAVTSYVQEIAPLWLEAINGPSAGTLPG